MAMMTQYCERAPRAKSERLYERARIATTIGQVFEQHQHTTTQRAMTVAMDHWMMLVDCLLSPKSG